MNANRHKPLRIGISAALVHRGRYKDLALGLPVLVLLESLAHWVMSQGDVALMIPTPPGPEWKAPHRWYDVVHSLDALVLQGGADIAPASYGEEPAHPDWGGDACRDAYELALLREFLQSGKPVLGICRGMQLLNVAMGGSLYQDIPEQYPNGGRHRDLEAALGAIHEVRFAPEGSLAQLYAGRAGGSVVSVHHQAVRRLGQGLRVEATSAEDGLIEAVRLEGPRYALGLQWHPEIQPPGDAQFLNPDPILEEFRAAARVLIPA